MIFLDTYPLVKLCEDPAYLEEYRGEEGATLKTNLAELHQVLLRKYGEEVADYLFEIYSGIAQATPLKIIPDSSKFKFENDENFSYQDALGYHYALNNNMKFVTGDRSFKGMEKVEIRR